MKKFNHRDFDIETELITTRDGSIRGNLVNWDTVRRFQEEDILESLDIYLPWGEELDLWGYMEFIDQQIFREYPELLTEYKYDGDFSFENMRFSQVAKSIYDISIEFPAREDYGIDNIIDAIFEICEVPKGTMEEEDLPSDLQFWPSFISDEDNDFYISITEHEWKVNDFQAKIKKLKDEIIQERDELKKKSMLLTCLILVESLVTSVILDKMPNIDSTNIKDIYHRKVVQESIISSVRNHAGRNKLFSQYFGEPLPQQSWISLRNSLAHDIGNSKLNKNIINVHGKDYNIISVIDKITNFSNELSKIIDKTADYSDENNMI